MIQSPCQIARSRQGVGKELGVDYRVLENIGDFCQEACVQIIAKSVYDDYLLC